MHDEPRGKLVDAKVEIQNVWFFGVATSFTTSNNNGPQAEPAISSRKTNGPINDSFETCNAGSLGQCRIAFLEVVIIRSFL